MASVPKAPASHSNGSPDPAPAASGPEMGNGVRAGAASSEEHQTVLC